MKVLYIVLLTSLTIVKSIVAQPELLNERMFTLEDDISIFDSRAEIYHPNDGLDGFLFSRLMLVTRYDSLFNVVYSSELEHDRDVVHSSSGLYVFNQGDLCVVANAYISDRISIPILYLLDNNGDEYSRFELDTAKWVADILKLDDLLYLMLVDSSLSYSITCVSTNGNIIFRNELALKSEGKFVEMIDDELVIVGKYQDGNYYLVYLNHEGRELRTAELQLDSVSELKFISKCDNDYVFIGKTTLDNQLTSVIGRYRQNGEEVWFRSLLQDWLHARGSTNYIKDKDGHFLVLLYSYWEAEHKLVKIHSENGNLLWQTLVGSTYTRQISSVILRNNGNYLVATFNLDHENFEYVLFSEFSPSYVSVPEARIELPASYYLAAAYPNPFNNETRISYGLASDGKASVKVYDISGRLVATLVDAELNAGNYNVIWNAEGFSTGVYFVKMETATFTETRKVVLMK